MITRRLPVFRRRRIGISSCTLDYVVGYVYMTTAKSNPGVIDGGVAVDYRSGALASIGHRLARASTRFVVLRSLYWPISST